MIVEGLGSRHRHTYTPHMRAAHLRKVIVAICLVGGSGVACREKDNASNPALTVFVAASLAEVTEGLAADFRLQTGIDVKISIAASGILRRQIEAGAPCDVFISADAIEIDRLARKKLVLPETRSLLAYNQLVVVTRGKGETWTDPNRLTDAGQRIAIGDPRYVPVGRYTEEALQRLNLWHAVQSRLILADNVRVALQYVMSEQADFAIVYATDVRTSYCRIVYTFPMDAPQVACFAAVCSASTQREISESLVRFLKDEAMANRWAERGFICPGDAPDR
ncbi:MAG: molybdate ABC transporter substrate-binding protein [Planctomycetes bacterium]|nr:molybdate ABC transporter substrate-binding protein [Planctomycetota bacterium]